MKNSHARRLWPALVCLLSAAALGQGVLTYPDKLYYKFNEGTGTTVLNWANPGLTSYQPTFPNGGLSAGGQQIQWDNATPLVGTSALNFNRADRLITNYPTVLTASFTIETWFRSNVVQVPGCASTACNLQRLWSDYNYTAAAPFRCYVGFYNVGANFLGGGFNGTYGATGLQGSTAYVLDGQWHHSALVYDQAAGTLTSYVDGNLDQQATGITTAATAPASANFIVGASGTPTTIVPDPFNGTIDEFRWWGEARSQLQIQNGMLGEIPEPNTRALFAANRRAGAAHLVVAFKDFSVAAPGTSIAARLWDFGDGQQSIAANPCHVYTAPGNYTVTLTVTDTASGMDSRAFTNYINVGAQALTVHSCGQGDLYMATPTPPPLWGDAYTVLSQTTNLPAGYGWFFGLVPDTLTFSALAYPAVPGSPLHALNVANPALWPESPLVFPPGTFTNLTGLVLDAAVVYRDPAGIVIGWTSVSRARF